MATATYVPLATQTLGSAASSITFSSIPSGYTDLRIVTNLFTTTGPVLTFNGDSNPNYSNTYILGNGSSSSTSSNTNVNYVNLTLPDGGSSGPSLLTFDIFSYRSGIYKTLLTISADDYNGTTAKGTSLVCGLWRSTAAITSVTISGNGGNFSTGSTATLWGI
jgi:hypothetical protein